MIDRRTFLGAAAAAAAVPLLGCSDKSNPAGAPTGGRSPVVLRLPGEKINFPSPFAYGGGIGYIHLSLLYDTLLWKDATGAYVGWLADKHERGADGRSYTVSLRPGVTWSDGQPLTSEDVAFTFTYLEKNRAQLAPTVISTPNPGVIEATRVIDPRTVELRLKQPDWTFEQFTGLGGIAIMPKHVWSEVTDPGKQRDPKLLVGTGPYRLESMDLGAGAYQYVARDDYFVGKPAVSRIEYVPVGDPLNALLAGEVHQAGGVGPGTGLRPQAVRPFEGKPDFRVMEAPVGHTVTALYWNLAAGGPMADPRFRHACAYAIDRQDLVRRLFEGKGAPGNPGLLPPGNPQHVAVEQYAFDPARAESLLDDMGLRRPESGAIRVGPGGPVSLELLTSSAQPQPVVQLVVDALRKVGIEVRPASVDLATFGQRRTGGQTQLSINTFGGTNTDEQPDGLGKVYASNSRALQRTLGYRNAQVDRLVDEQRRSLDPAARTSMAHQVQQAVAADLPMLPLYYPPLTTIVRTAPFGGWFDTPGGVGGLVPHVNNKLAFVTGAGRKPE